MPRSTAICLCALGLAAISTQPAGAVIVAGTFGTGNNNNTQAGLDAYLASTSYAAFPYWDNLVRVTDASGVYLGFNASTMNGWVLSANHVTPATSINVAGSSYSVISSTQIGSSDLKLYEIGGAAMPSLPTVPLASVGATASEFLLMAGRGFTNNTSSPYAWGTPGTSDLNGMRWATNTVESTAMLNLGTVLLPNIQPYIVTDFDAAGDTGVTAYDGQGSLGDSGGGIFIYRGGEWELSGTTHLVDDGPDFFEDPPTGDGVINPAQPGDFTAYSDVFAKLATINAETGVLIPEPTTLASLLPALALLFGRRRRR